MGCLGLVERGKQGAPIAEDSPLSLGGHRGLERGGRAGLEPSSEPGLRVGASAAARAFPEAFSGYGGLRVPASLPARADGPRVPRPALPAYLLPAEAGQLLLGEEPHRGASRGGARRLPGLDCGQLQGQRQDQGQRGQRPQPPPRRGACHGKRAEHGQGSLGCGARALQPAARNPAPRAPAAPTAAGRDPDAPGSRRWKLELGRISTQRSRLSSCGLKVEPKKDVCCSSSLIRYIDDTAPHSSTCYGIFMN